MSIPELELTVNQWVLVYASGKLGQHVQAGPNTPGECADLADWALTQAGAKSFKELGPTGPKDKYVWGAKIKIDEVQAGDILQIGHYKYKTETKHGKMPPETHLGELHHHTAIVSDIMDPKTGAIPVLDQHWVRAAHAQHGQWLVQEWVLYTRNVPEAVTYSSDYPPKPTTFTARIKGAENILAYRPIKK